MIERERERERERVERERERERVEREYIPDILYLDCCSSFAVENCCWSSSCFEESCRSCYVRN